MRPRTILPAVGLLIAVTATAPAQEAADLEPYAAKAREAVKSMGAALQTKLKEAIASGGPVAAVTVCNTLAPQITSEQSASSGMTIKRTSLRVRNPSNAPDPLEKRVLEDFEAKVSSGAAAASLEHIEEVSEGGKMLVRYFKAIPTTNEPCLTCHGSNVSGELKQTIDKLYPHDAATGFAAGDLRGAFSVTMEKTLQ